MRPVHQLAQYESGPTSRDGGESNLHRAAGIGAPGAAVLVRDELPCPKVSTACGISRAPFRVGFRLVTYTAARFADLMSIPNNAIHGPIVPLTTDPEQHPAVFAASFNTGNEAAVQNVYEPGAVFVAHPGQPLTADAMAQALRGFLQLGLPITVHPRHTYIADDIALLIVDWVVDGPGPKGEHVHIEGTATDVARRGADGRWRYIIDNPFGTARPDA